LGDLVKATHEAWDELLGRDVPVCTDHAETIADGRGGYRFDGSTPRPITRKAVCTFDCHRLGCHGTAKETAS
jgi:hypothetical protein